MWPLILQSSLKAVVSYIAKNKQQSIYTNIKDTKRAGKIRFIKRQHQFSSNLAAVATGENPLFTVADINGRIKRNLDYVIDNIPEIFVVRSSELGNFPVD